MRMSESMRKRTAQGKLKIANTMQGPGIDCLAEKRRMQSFLGGDTNAKPAERRSESHEALLQKHKALQAKNSELEARVNELELLNESMGQELWDLRKAHATIQQDH